MALRPTGYPTWCATGATNVAQPDGTHQGVGWAVNEAPPSSYFNFNQQLYDRWIRFLDASVIGLRGGLWFGDGSDGVATLAAGTPTTLARDMFYSRLNVASGATMCAGNFRIKVADTLTNQGTIHADSPNAIGNTAPAPLAWGTLWGGASGGRGMTSVGLTGALALFSIGGAGGTGGGGGGSAGGISNPVTAPPAFAGSAHDSAAILSGMLVGPTGVAALQGGSGGSGGGGPISGGGYGGAGGPGGGILAIAARSIVNLGGVFSARGGGGATGFSNICGGGGGGGGGGALFAFIDATGLSGAINVSGGNGGLGAGGGGPGFTGSTGQIFILTPPAY